MSNLLQELKKLSPILPEAECFVPEWNRTVKLRGFTVSEGRALRKTEAKNKQGEIADQDSFMIKMIANSIVDGDERPLANKDGIALVEALSEASAGRLIRAINGLSVGVDLEKNSATTGNGDASSELPVEAADQLPN